LLTHVEIDAEKNFFLFLLVSAEDMPMFLNILFPRLTFVMFYHKITNKCKRIGSKQTLFGCSMTSQVTFTYYLLLNSFVNW